MEEQLITYETALLAKEKGFDVKVRHHWFHNTDEPLDDEYYIRRYDECHNFNELNRCDVFSAPTQSLLQKWLYENHGIHVEVTIDTYESPNTLATTIQVLNDERTDVVKDILPYEVIPHHQLDEKYEALEIGLREALKLIETK